eukprot:GSChrysophyteH2.ASY1.ANO1.1283.1 assembled CDS
MALTQDDPALPFDIALVCEIITTHGYKRVVLQFPDEHLVYCVPVYEYLLAALNPTDADDDAEFVDIFISADSTYGSSVDDVSADHVDAQVLVYFGSDLSSSGTMAVLVAPLLIQIDVDHCHDEISKALQRAAATATAAEGANTENAPCAVVLFEPGCAQGAKQVQQMLCENTMHSGVKIALATLPLVANLAAWAPTTVSQGEPTFAVTDGYTTVGGLVVPEEVLTDTSCQLIYIGEKAQQIQAISLQLGLHELITYSPSSRSILTLRGESTLPFRQRYGGIARVKSASIVGIIVGSMGLTGGNTRLIIERVQAVCAAAGKKTYTFIMGRLNEAKLCNFPEVDIFCFISNEDVGVIPPKTFHAPVLTPWELEIGVGAREWTSSYMSNPTAILESRDESKSGSTENTNQNEDDDANSLRNDLPSVLRRVRRSARREQGLDSSSEEEDEDDDESAAARANANAMSNALTNTAGGNGATSMGADGTLTVFHSPAGEFLQARDYQGLVREVEAGKSLEVQQGLTGIAASYGEMEQEE